MVQCETGDGRRASGDRTATNNQSREYVNAGIREGVKEGVQINLGQTERVLSFVAGGLLTLYGISKGKRGLPLAVLGAPLIYRGVTGYSHTGAFLGTTPEDRTRAPWNRKLRLEETITINRPRGEVYAFWRDFENLPKFMKHLENVRPRGEGSYHWVARAPVGRHVSWNAEISQEVENELIAWHSVGKADVDNWGVVEFHDSAEGGTEVHVVLEYIPPGGMLGSAVARMLGDEPHSQVREDLRRFKNILETGRIEKHDGEVQVAGEPASWEEQLNVKPDRPSRKTRRSSPSVG